MSNESILSNIKNDLTNTPELGATRDELVTITTLTGPKKALVTVARPSGFFKRSNGGYSANAQIELATIAAAIRAEAGLLIAIRPLGLHANGNARPVPPAANPVKFLEAPSRSNGWIEPKTFAHASLGTLVEGNISGVLTEEEAVAGWLSPSAVRLVGKAILEAKAAVFRPSIWLRPSDEPVPPPTQAEVAEAAEDEAAEAAKGEGVPLDKAETATGVATDEVTA